MKRPNPKACCAPSKAPGRSAQISRPRLRPGRSVTRQLLRESTEQLWLTGIVVLAPDGNTVCEYSSDDRTLARVHDNLDRDIILDTAIHDEKVYSQRINQNDGSHIDMSACARGDAPRRYCHLLLYLC